MFRVIGSSGTDCTGLTRRSFVQAGILGVGGLTLGDFLHAKAWAALTPDPFPKGKGEDSAVILFWLSGGPGHMETWDPKPDAPAQYRGPLGAIRTSVPGIQVGELLPNQARLMDHLAIVRTVR